MTVVFDHYHPLHQLDCHSQSTFVPYFPTQSTLPGVIRLFVWGPFDYTQSHLNTSYQPTVPDHRQQPLLNYAEDSDTIPDPPVVDGNEIPSTEPSMCKAGIVVAVL